MGPVGESITDNGWQAGTRRWLAEKGSLSPALIRGLFECADFRVLFFMPTPSKAQLQIQLDRLSSTGFGEMLTQFSQANDLPRSFFYAIASRETNCRNILGDIRDDGPHGVGIVQIDIQHQLPGRLEILDHGRRIPFL
jgi:hypothetical protein